MEQVGVASLVNAILVCQSDFAAKERIVWVDIEGVPLNAWTRSTFQNISSKWGELVELEDGYDDLFARKHIPEAESDRPPSRSARSNSRVLEEAENSVDRVSSESFSNGVKIKEGGSILEILEEMITVGQTMGFSMEGCTKDMEKIIGTQGEQLVFR
ncbi:hypothetical protein Tco_1577456 [Tanacetum coccineum]